MRTVIRARHYSLRTEETSLSWVKRFILFHGKRHPRDMGAQEVQQFLQRSDKKLGILQVAVFEFSQ
jgi:hypothetical protein